MRRRDFLRAAAAGGAALAIPETLDALMARLARGAPLSANGYGPLVRDPKGLMDLPAGFDYVTLSAGTVHRTDDPRFSDRLSNGEFVPARHDGMAAFAGPPGITVLVRNHEMNAGETPRVDEARRRPYDPLAAGGTTTVWVDDERRVIKSFPSLSGTMRNCAGGRTPWNSWLSAEEVTFVPGQADPLNADRQPLVSKRHGYVFEVDSRAKDLVEPVPILGLGRFYHEAVAVDPSTAFVYLSEDRADGLLYRYRPAVVTSGAKRPNQLGPGDLAKGGVLEALAVARKPSARTQNWEDGPRYAIGRKHAVHWIRIPDIDPDMDLMRDPTDAPTNPTERKLVAAPTSMRAQGFRLGAAQFGRTEGMLFHHGAVYWCCTNGGRARAGQVWRLDPRRNELSLLVEPDDPALLDGPDNLCASPYGDLIVCEDGHDDNYLVGITRDGRLYKLARNAYNGSELAGACFSPDGRTLFFNMQNPGVTFAVRGPWERRA